MINTFLGSFESAQEALKEDRRVAAVLYVIYSFYLEMLFSHFVFVSGADAPSPSKNRHFFYRFKLKIFLLYSKKSKNYFHSHF